MNNLEKCDKLQGFEVKNVIETSLMVNDYPEPPELKEKCYYFKFNATTKGCGYVYAENHERAEELINSGEYEVDYTYDMEIEEITKIEEED